MLVTASSMYAQYRIIRLTAPVFQPSEQELAVLAAHGLSVVMVDAEDPEVLIPRLTDADVVMVVGTQLPTSVVQAMHKCRLIARLGAGTDKIDVAGATALGIVVANTPYFCVQEQADHSMAMLLSLARKLTLASNAMAEGNLMRARRSCAGNQRLSCQTLGLVGFGRSAVQTAQRARGFGMHVLATRRSWHAATDEADALGVVMTDLDTVLRESDYVSLHLPLTTETHHLIDALALNKMRPTACLINTARGALVDESALYDALRQGRLAGAGIDTFEEIDIFAQSLPPRMHPLTGLENVILTPHVAGRSVQSSEDSYSTAAANIIDVLSGHWPPAENIVNSAVVPRFPLQSLPGT